MPSQDATVTGGAVRTAPPVSRTLHLLVGAWLLFVVISNANGRLTHLALGMGAAFVALLVLYVALHLLVARHRLDAVLRKLVAVAPVAALYFLGGDGMKLGVLGYFGVSLVLASLRGDPGCEVTTIPTLLLRRPAYLPCLIFSPIDHLEEALTRGVRKSG